MEVYTIEDGAKMKEALRLMPYHNRPPRTPLLQGNKGIRKGNRTVKITY